MSVLITNCNINYRISTDAVLITYCNITYRISTDACINY